jgi:putative ABC transport system ATP-binding protein/macrolide transport system ATP-binding/permease protein/lipoprotein-releasing system ATP-binding protein
MLSVRGLAKRYGTERAVDAVREVSFELERGRFLAIVGRSGSGKSTLLAMIGGISKPTGGSVIIEGIDEWSLDDNARADFRNGMIGFVFQFASLLPNLRAIDNVALPAIVGGTLEAHEAYMRARTLLGRVGLGDRVDAYSGELSGGEQRRVAVARALINSPKLLLADEPTADLDEETEQQILNLLVGIHRAFGVTLVVVTHNSAIAARADMILEMRDGSARASELPDAQPNGAVGPWSPEVTTAAQIFDSVSSAATEVIRLGEGIERLLGRFVLWGLPIIVLTWSLNRGARLYEQRVIQAKLDAQSQLETLAMQGLRADVKDISVWSWKDLHRKPVFAKHDRRSADLCHVTERPRIRASRGKLARGTFASGQRRCCTGAQGYR